MSLAEIPVFWVYPLISLSTMIEGPLATLAAGFLAATSWINPVGVFIAASLGNLIGDTFWYIVGYLGKVEWIFRHPRLIPLNRDHLEQLLEDIHSHAPKLLFMSKITLGLAIPTLLAAGLARVPLRRWYWVQVLAEVIWTGALTALGFLYGQYLFELQRGVQIIMFAVTVLLLASLMVYVRNLTKSNK